MAVRDDDWIADHARRTLKRLASGRRFTYREADARVPELPHNATGKILKRELRLAYGAK